jgi:single-stranded DNA-binding protein
MATVNKVLLSGKVTTRVNVVTQPGKKTGVWFQILVDTGRYEDGVYKRSYQYYDCWFQPRIQEKIGIKFVPGTKVFVDGKLNQYREKSGEGTLFKNYIECAEVTLMEKPKLTKENE